MAKLRIENLSKYYGSLKCLDNVNLEVDNDQLAVIVGPSGCGKSTLLRCVAGLETFSEGFIFIDEELINDKEPRFRDVAMVFQYYALYPHMTVRKNLSLGLENTTKLTKDQIQKRVEEIADMLKIFKLIERKPGQLSGGESQRVAIGRALVRKPKIFLLDEPLSAVDAKLRRDLRIEVKKIQRNFGVTTIYVTHDQEEAMALGDKIVVLCDGRIHQIGSPEEVYDSPNNQFVAGFIGNPPMNFFEMEVNNKNGKYFLESKELAYEISTEYFNRYLKNHLGRKVVMGIRPSVIRMVTPHGSYSLSKTNNATVSLIENMGNEDFIYLTLDSKRIIMKMKSEDILQIGDKIKISFEEEEMHLFDFNSKKSLKK